MPRQAEWREADVLPAAAQPARPGGWEGAYRLANWKVALDLVLFHRQIKTVA